MKKQLWIALLAVVCAAGAAASAFLFLSKDRQGPVINVPETQITYQEGGDTETLLAGVTAKDDIDGDVSDSLIVEGIYPTTDDSQAKIVYAAIDKSNNVTKAERMVDYVSETAAGAGAAAPNDAQGNAAGENGTANGTGNTASDENADAEDSETETENESETEEADLTSSVVVLNGTGEVGVAAAWQSTLEEEGFTDVSIGNYTQTIESSLIYTEDDALAAALMELLPGAERVTTLNDNYADVSTTTADACVVVGSADVAGE